MEELDSWSGYYVLDDDGNPRPERDLLAWGRWMETARRRVALTNFAGGFVSTVFLGLDHSFCLDPMADPLHYRPVLWETMVFGGKLDGEMKRYRSREEAILGHEAMVKECITAEEDNQTQIEMEAIKTK